MIDFSLKMMTSQTIARENPQPFLLPFRSFYLAFTVLSYTLNANTDVCAAERTTKG